MQTGLNYTTEWYELFQLFNCTFPHVVSGRADPLWCNQGAACLYPGIDDAHWKEDGILEKVTELTGDQFNKLADYIRWDNKTGLFYETWRVLNSTDPASAFEWFVPYDCADYVFRVYNYMATLGAKFTQTYKPMYTFISLISDMPQFLGNETDIFGPTHTNETVAKQLMSFYSNFQPHQSVLNYAEHLLAILDDVVLRKEFYFYYSSSYWYLPMKEPYVHLSYEYVPWSKN